MEWAAFFNDISWVAIILFIAGIVLITIEMYIPGFGVTGITGVICLLLGIFLSGANFFQGVILMLIAIAILSVLFVVVLNSLSKGKMNKTLVLNEEQNKDKGYISSDDLNYFINKTGTALTDLRPAGSADIEGVKLDVYTDGEYLTSGTPIKIIKVQGNRILVTKYKK